MMDWRSCNYFLFDGNLTGSRLNVVLKNFKGFLKEYKDHGLNTVSLTWMEPVDPTTGKILHQYAGNVPDYFSSLPTPAVLKALTAAAHAAGFKVMWKPQFVTNDDKAGNINSYFAPHINVPAFLSNVKAYWQSLAPSAQQAHVNLLILGTEQGDYAGPAYDSNWRDIIASVRAVFTGELTYDELSYIGRPGQAADKTTFWDALDYIGISMYLPLATDNTPTLSEAYAALYSNQIYYGSSDPRVNVPAILQALTESTGKDIIFTEAGSQSRTGALTNPPFTTGPLNYWEQAALYAVLMDEFSKYHWFRGFNWWTNDHDFKTPPGTHDWMTLWSQLHLKEFSFLEKPAADILTAFWANGGNGAPISGHVLLGKEASDVLTGGNLDDVIVAAGGNDRIRGLDGNDRLFGGDGQDRIDGGGGNDLIYGGDSFRDGKDTIQGGLGNDKVFGGYGPDVVSGGPGDDLVNGGPGNDKLIGGPGIDTLTGGLNNDTFVFNAPLSALNRDKITDFNHVADTFQLENAVMKTLGAGVHTLSAGMFRAGAAAADANDHVIYNRANGHLSYDSNGNGVGGVTLLAVLTNKPVLAADDFVVI
jgi:hypothetical protein